MGFPAVVKGNHSHLVLTDTPLNVDAVTDASQLLWHKYLKGQLSKNSHPYYPPVLLSPALDNMKVVTEFMAGLCICTNDRIVLYIVKQTNTYIILIFFLNYLVIFGNLIYII
jgi:hypothetical protein